MKKKYLRWLMVISWMVFIFVFSSQNGDNSSNNNRFIVAMFNNLGINLDQILSGQANLIIRKLAHMTEYFILFMLVFNALKTDLKFRKNLLISIVIIFAYAGSDEIHQSFVPGRACMFTDVLIDTAGAGFAVIGKIFVQREKSLALKKKDLIKTK
jgi:VanZ family protein